MVSVPCPQQCELIGVHVTEHPNDLFFCLYEDSVAELSVSVNRHTGGSSRIRFCGEAVRRKNDDWRHRVMKSLNPCFIGLSDNRVSEGSDSRVCRYPPKRFAGFLNVPFSISSNRSFFESRCK